ncbi:hypothetical protein C8Q70DRAFT_265597 [Cubamyces menziesii]|nr:hypothetical protein C8Q70DRAFT_265597 [Cubamyces menziesii]
MALFPHVLCAKPPPSPCRNLRRLVVDPRSAMTAPIHLEKREQGAHHASLELLYHHEALRR